MDKTRDFKLKLKERFVRKENVNPILRGVITDALGNQSGTGTIWANVNTKRVWWMAHGATNPAQIRCQRIPSPYIGLKVIAGIAAGCSEIQILSDNPLDRMGNTNGSNWTTLDTPDLLPGGRAMLWLQTKAIEPLATWPGTGLAVNINPGNYQYNSLWTSYIGTSNYDLSAFQPAGPNEHCLVGLWLDSGGALNAVAGATVGTGLTPPAPAWPADVVRLATVKITDSAVSFSFALDITDWRGLWNDPVLGGWPYDHVLTVDPTDPSADYATIQTAITAAVDGDAILVGAGTYTENLVIANEITLIGLGQVIITAATSPTIEIDAAGKFVYLDNLEVFNTDDAGDSVALYTTNGSNGKITNCDFTGEGAGAATNCYGVQIDDGSDELTFIDCWFMGKNGVVLSYGLVVDGTVYLYDGYASGVGDDILVSATGTLQITGTQLSNGSIDNSGGLYGDYVTIAGDIVIVPGNELDTDTINETTAAAGVTVEGVLLKDSEVVAPIRVQAPAHDYPLVDSANVSGLSSHFAENGATYPAGWTEVNAATTTNTNTVPSFWYLTNNTATTTWKYRYKTAIDLEALTAGYWACFLFGPLAWRDTLFAADVEYAFGLYRDNAGAIDEQTYCRFRVRYNNASTVWQVRGEEKDGTTPHNGTYYSLSIPPMQPIYGLATVNNGAAKLSRAKFGYCVLPNTQLQILNQTPSVAPTWGPIWVQVELTTKPATTDFLYIGAIDYVGNIG